MDLVNEGKFYIVDSLLSANSALLAATYNSSVTPDFNSDYNQKVFYEIYAATWAKEIYDLTLEQDSLLRFIAYQNPINGGTAVYSARVMLDIELDDEDISGSRSALFTPSSIVSHVNSQKTNSSILIYPNPVADYINLKTVDGQNITGKLYIFNNLGQQSICKNIEMNNGKMSVDLHNLSNGLYQLLIKNDDEVLIRKKFLIFK